MSLSAHDFYFFVDVSCQLLIVNCAENRENKELNCDILTELLTNNEQRDEYGFEVRIIFEINVKVCHLFF